MKPENMTRKEYAVLCACRDYANYLGIPMPEILFKDNLDLAYPIRLGSNALARCFNDRNVIRITTRTQSIPALDGTMAHEMIHMKFENLIHGIRFEKYISALRKKAMFFNGRGLVTEFPKPNPEPSAIQESLIARIKKLSSKIKRLETHKKKLLRKLRRLNSENDQT